MAYYALINSDNVVVKVITGVDENLTQTDLDGTQVGGSTDAWEQFYASLPWHEGLYCRRTSYNTFAGEHSNNGIAFRGNFAGIGHTYDKDFDVFIPQKPFPSWKLNYTTFQWEAPIPMPEIIEGFDWRWSEINQEWIQVEILSV
jgi:hypothetical protein